MYTQPLSCIIIIYVTASPNHWGPYSLITCPHTKVLHCCNIRLYEGKSFKCWFECGFFRVVANLVHTHIKYASDHQSHFLCLYYDDSNPHFADSILSCGHSITSGDHPIPFVRNAKVCIRPLCNWPFVLSAHIHFQVKSGIWCNHYNHVYAHAQTHSLAIWVDSVVFGRLVINPQRNLQ